MQTVAFQAYVNKTKHNIYESKVRTIRANIAKSLGIRWFHSFDELNASGISEEEQMIWYGNYHKVRELANKQASKIAGFPPAVDISDFVDHIDYMVNKIGIDHVGISSDFDGGGGVKGWNDASETFNVTLEHVKRGYSEEEINALWNGNILRVLDECQALSRNL